MIKIRIATTLAVMAIMLCLAVAPALAETKNGPLVFSNYYDASLGKFDPMTGQWGTININAYGRYPDVTSDGKTVVYSSSEGEIYSVPMYDGHAAPTTLTTNGPNFPRPSKAFPTVSPDGQTVYFAYTASDDNGRLITNDIYSVPIEGGDITQVTHDHSGHDGLEITPDGENFVYGGGGDGRDIYVQPVSGGAATTLYACEELIACGHPAVSPDGTKVAFIMAEDADSSSFAVYTMPFSTTGGSTPMKVPGSEVSDFGDPGADMTVDFSPDGKYIAYNALKDGSFNSGTCGRIYCGRAQTRWIPVEGGNYNSRQWHDWYGPLDVVWAPAADTTKPTSTAASSPQANSAGWNNSEVKITLSATDNDGGSGVEKITYSSSGAQSIVRTDASGSSVDVKLDQEGTTTLTYYATDKSGNVETPKSLTVKIDSTSPLVSSMSPMNNATGVAATAEVSATFAESGAGTDAATLTTSTFKVVQVKPTGNVQVSGTVSYDESSQTATFDPSSSLAKGLYRATLTTGVKDKAGNALANAYTWSFATAGPSNR